MKKQLLILLSLFITGISYGQYLSLGPAGSFGASRITGNEKYFSDKFHPSYSAGIGVIYARHEHWGFGGELAYSREGNKLHYSNGNIDYDLRHNLDYFRLPLRVYYFFGKYQQKVRPKIYAGPTLGILCGQDTRATANNTATQNLFNTADMIFGYTARNVDVGLHIGTGINVNISKLVWLNVDVAYYQGLVGLEKQSGETSGDSKTHLNQNLRLGAGLFFKLR